MVPDIPREVIIRQLGQLLSRFLARDVHPTEQLAINHDLHLRGEDAWEFFDAVHACYGTRFDELNWNHFFVDPRVESVWAYFRRKLRGEKTEPLSVGRLADAIQSGAWSEQA